MTRRLAGCLTYIVNDFACAAHILPQYVSKVASADTLLLAEENDDEFLDQLENCDWYKKRAALARGTRTLREVAHFVRCVQITPDCDLEHVWSTPDVMLTMRQGQVHDHALLLASMFRAVKYETYEELHRVFVRGQVKRNEAGGKTIQALLKKAGVPTKPGQAADDGDDDEEEEEEGKADEAEANGDDDSDDEDGEKDDSEGDDDGDDDEGGGGDAEDDELEDVSDDEAAAAAKAAEDDDDFQNETIEDRVFVCVGRYRGGERPAVWVMTIDADFQVVTLWNPVQHRETTLRGRIYKDQVDNLKAYLTPFKVQKDLASTQPPSERRADERYRERIKRWREEYKEKVEGQTGDDDEEDEDDGNDSYGDMLEDGAEKKDENSSDDEYKQDDDIIDPDEIIVKHNDLAQVLKGYRIENVGQEAALGIEYQTALEKRRNIDESPDEDDDEATAAPDQANNFFAAQAKERE